MLPQISLLVSQTIAPEGSSEGELIGNSAENTAAEADFLALLKAQGFSEADLKAIQQQVRTLPISLTGGDVLPPLTSELAQNLKPTDLITPTLSVAVQDWLHKQGYELEEENESSVDSIDLSLGELEDKGCQHETSDGSLDTGPDEFEPMVGLDEPQADSLTEESDLINELDFLADESNEESDSTNDAKSNEQVVGPSDFENSAADESSPGDAAMTSETEPQSSNQTADIDENLASEQISQNFAEVTSESGDRVAQPVNSPVDSQLKEKTRAERLESSANVLANNSDFKVDADKPTQKASLQWVQQEVLPQDEVKPSAALKPLDASNNVRSGEATASIVATTTMESTETATVKTLTAPPLETEGRLPELAPRLEAASRARVAVPATPVESMQSLVDQAVTSKLGNLSEAVAGQVMVSLGQQLKRAFIRLDPPELGLMEVRVQVQQEQTQIQIVTASPQVRDALENQAHKLREALAEHGLQLDDLDLADQSQQHASEREEGDNPGNAATAGDDDPENDSSVSAVGPDQAVGLVDHYV